MNWNYDEVYAASASLVCGMACIAILYEAVARREWLIHAVKLAGMGMVGIYFFVVAFVPVTPEQLAMLQRLLSRPGTFIFCLAFATDVLLIPLKKWLRMTYRS